MRLWIAAVVVACAAPCVHAETLYVIEQLFVTVSSASDGTGNRVGQIKSGDHVELIERQGDQAHVRLASGEEGWVRASYLSADPPLRQQLTARAEELERVRKEKAQLETELASARSAAAAANASGQMKPSDKDARPAGASPQASAAAASTTAANGSPAGASAVDQTVAASAGASAAEPASQPAPPLFQDEPMMPARPSWMLALGSAAVALVIGFALGWRMLDRRIRAKYGGLRIY